LDAVAVVREARRPATPLLQSAASRATLPEDQTITASGPLELAERLFGVMEETSGSSGSHSATPTSVGTSSGASPGAPIKIALLGFETGVYATPDRHNAMQLAIKQINASGGIDGHMLQYTAYDTGILPQTTLTAVEKAISPGAIIKGLGSISYDGVCDRYQSDNQHTLAHTMYIVQFGAAHGQQTLVARYDNLISS
jgi:ABC-type branched-subunit amino acid transport system substrate-binding protein